MGYVNGVNLLPSTGEFTYDTIPYLGRRITEPALTSINRYASGGPLAGAGSTTDCTIAINNLQAEIPGCTTVSLVVAWFGNSTDITRVPDLSVDDLHQRNVRAGGGRGGCVALFGPDAKFGGAHSDSAERRRVSSMAARRRTSQWSAAFAI